MDEKFRQAQRAQVSTCARPLISATTVTEAKPYAASTRAISRTDSCHDRLSQPCNIFGWPSYLGGADTKLAHLLVLLHRDYRITVVPNDVFRLRETKWTRFMDRHGIRYARFGALPKKLEGFGLALCNPRFLNKGLAQRVKDRGLKMIWSGEMVWHHPGELEAIKAGVIDKVLFVSEVQRRRLIDAYGSTPSVLTGNFIDPKFFPFAVRRNSTFSIGRLSRPDPAKYPEDFPVFYEALEVPEVRFRIMAWDKNLTAKYRWHRFDARWELLPSLAETQLRFLRSLDLFVYPLGHTCIEAWVGPLWRRDVDRLHPGRSCRSPFRTTDRTGGIRLHLPGLHGIPGGGAKALLGPRLAQPARPAMPRPRGRRTLRCGKAPAHLARGVPMRERYCFWSVATGRYTRMLQGLVGSARGVGSSRTFTSGVTDRSTVPSLIAPRPWTLAGSCSSWISWSGKCENSTTTTLSGWMPTHGSCGRPAMSCGSFAAHRCTLVLNATSVWPRSGEPNGRGVR